MHDDTPQLRKLLQEPENIEVAFDLADIVEDIREEARVKFWDNVRDAIAGMMANSNVDNLWEVYQDKAILGIGWKECRQGCRQFSASIERIDRPNGMAFMAYGVAKW